MQKNVNQKLDQIHANDFSLANCCTHPSNPAIQSRHRRLQLDLVIARFAKLTCKPCATLVNHNHNGYCASMRKLRENAFLFAFLFLLLSYSIWLPAADAAQDAAPATAQAVRQLTPIMPIDQVKVGMKGYGLTVFHGAKIEAFPVEVISVQRDFAPKRGVIWISCTDPRLLKTGPVQGMSGSPIYLFEEGDKEAGTLGKGGKLIGAFAFGFGWTKDCYAGVQPIELMRETAGKIDNMKDGEKDGVKDVPKAQGASRTTITGATLIDLLRYADSEGLGESETWRARSLGKLVGIKDASERDPRNKRDQREASAVPLRIAGPDSLASHVEGKPVRMMLPMAVGSAALAKVMAPLLEPMGIVPMQSQVGTTIGLPPPDTDAKAIELEPGSVLSIPLAFGDADLSATGTVTDVLPDGRVLAFGHPMFGTGDSAMPMATGYVHFIVPRMSNAFKLGGSAVIKGTILQDDAAAVAGAPGKKFKTAPAIVHINMGGRKKTYKYEIVHHDRLTPSLVAAVITQSLTADQNLPNLNTLRMSGSATFEGNRKVELNACMAPGADQRLMFELVPVFSTMLQNPHGELSLESIELTIDVTEKMELLNVLGARVEKTSFEPGETIKAAVTLQRYGGDREVKRVEIQIPDSLPDGKYMLTIGDGRTLNRMLVMNRPHLMNTTSVDDVYDAVKLIMGIRQDTLYTMLQLPASGIAVGRQELPRLPSSKRALIASAQNTQATFFADWVQVATPMNAAVNGEVVLEIDVVKQK